MFVVIKQLATAHKVHPVNSDGSLAADPAKPELFPTAFEALRVAQRVGGTVAVDTDLEDPERWDGLY